MTRAIILAAGRGSRLHPLTENAPKCLTEFGGVSLLRHQLTTIRACGVTDILIATGYLCDQLNFAGTRQVHNPDWASTNMVETLFAGETEFGDDLLVCYADILYETKLIKALLAAKHDITVCINTLWRPLWERRFENPLEDAESLRLSESVLILEIGEKVADIDEIEGQFTGLMRFQGDGIGALRDAYGSIRRNQRPWQSKRNVDNAYMTDLLMELIHIGKAVNAVPVAGGWLEIDTLDDYSLVSRMFDDGTLDQFFDPSELSQRT